jgi:hypothetical protein
VLGAFKATPIRQLETEAYGLPLDLWINGRIAHFQTRLERTGLAIQAQPRSRRGPRQTHNTPASARKQWVEKWIGLPTEQWDEREKRKMLRD